MCNIIGDIHRHTSRLAQLLERLGYERDAQSWCHPGRKAIFVGDFIDRGPDELETNRLVGSLIDRCAALAVMGNHEFNAVAFKKTHPDQDGERLRSHTEKNGNRHATFLDRVGEYSALHDEIIAWFKTLPLYLDLDGDRVVHACWHDEAFNIFELLLDDRQPLQTDAWLSAATPGNQACPAAETLLKGLEIPLPGGENFLDKDGYERQYIRTRWWGKEASTYCAVGMLDEATRQTLPDQLNQADVLSGYAADKPMFVGHYWLRGTPEPMSDRSGARREVDRVSVGG